MLQWGTARDELWRSYDECLAVPAKPKDTILAIPQKNTDAALHQIYTQRPPSTSTTLPVRNCASSCQDVPATTPARGTTPNGRAQLSPSSVRPRGRYSQPIQPA